MNKNNLKIVDIVKDIYKNNKYCLPIIQREYVWSPNQIELLFDSLMRGYPIGSFLFWKYDKEIAKIFNFYNLVKIGSEDTTLNPEDNLIPKNESIGKIAILDGQQRLTSIYIGIYGKYNIHKKGTWKSLPQNYEEQYLYLNLLSDYIEKEELLNVNEKIYEFKFITEEEAKKDCKWFKVGDIIGNYFNINEVIAEVANTYPDNKKVIKKNLELLNKIINEDDNLIPYILVENRKMSEVLEIFERVNSYGKKLRKTDLLFSSIVSYWPDGHKKMNDLLRIINKKANLYNKFDINYIVLSSLILVGKSPKLKINSLTEDTIRLIMKKWEKINDAIEKSADLVSKMNMFDSTLKSTNALIPISYFIYKTDGKYLKRYKKNIKKYLQISLLKGIYGVHADTVLSDFIKAIDDRVVKTFSYNELCKVKVDNRHLYKVNEEDVEKMLSTTKSDMSLLVLSIIQKGLDVNNESYEQDHIHSKKYFNKNVFNTFPNISDDELFLLKNKINTIPNLQIIPKEENGEKLQKSLTQWINEEGKKITFQPKCSYELKDFNVFYNERYKLLRDALYKVFDIKAK